MTIFEYAVIRAARQRMTEQEVKLAVEMARRAEEGSASANDTLRKMVFEVLFDDRQPAASQPAAFHGTRLE